MGIWDRLGSTTLHDGTRKVLIMNMDTLKTMLTTSMVMNLVLILLLANTFISTPEKVPVTLFDRQQAWIKMCAWEFSRSNASEYAAVECVKKMPTI